MRNGNRTTKTAIKTKKENLPLELARIKVKVEERAELWVEFANLLAGLVINPEESDVEIRSRLELVYELADDMLAEYSNRFES